MTRLLALLLLLIALRAGATDIPLPPVPFGGGLRAQFTLTTTSGAPLAGIAVTITPLEGCGTVAGGPSTVVTTNSAGTATFDFVAGSRIGNCRIEGRNGNTVGYAATFVFNPNDLGVIEFASATPRVKTLSTSTSASFTLWAYALNERGVRVPLDKMPIGVQVVPDDNGAAATLKRVDPLTSTGNFGVQLDTNGVEGIYDLAVNAGGLLRTFRIVQSAPRVAESSKPVAALPLTMEPLTASVLPDTRAVPCKLTSVAYHPPGSWPTSLPVLGTFVAAMLDVGWTGGCDVVPYTLRVDFPQDVPAGTSFHATTGTGASALWTPLLATISGKSASLRIDPTRVFGNPYSVVVLSSGTAPIVPARPLVKDLWWSGLEENGWGMSIVQSADRSNLFPVVFAYDDKGAPTWWATGGWWDLAANVFHMGVLHPRGTSWQAYDPAILVLGAERGRAELSFADQDHATFDYRIDGRTGRKTLQRQPFGAAASSHGPDVGGMWWGGQSQPGWGVSISQQQDTLFSVWYTYDERGYPTWVVMPGGTWTSSNTYEGRVYRTHSSGWLGQAYDRSKLTVTDVGSYRFRFNGASAAFDYTIDGRSGTLALSRQSPF